MRFIEYVALFLLVIGFIYVMSMIFMILAVMFSGHFLPMKIDFSSLFGAVTWVFAALLVAIGLAVLFEYIPTVIREGEE